ncbi:Abscisic acid-responsive protein bHLH2 [Heracleum sosnowskyi]|uniref:Abscisic acid-responsive protein bHLH2 n=1 Tax=Heracleum sosnowskyi TaxID=360622 RepID=A0AAD8HLX9_9APIA|nr:Abscisic acid-responsive protein bHLH2 [Heracleum sosnowskyi]
MALSYYSNWVLDQQHLKQDQATTITTSNCNNIFFPQEQLLSQDLVLPPELLNFHDNFDTCIDTLFTQNNHFFCSDDNVDAYTSFSPSPVPLEMMVEEDACFDHYSKRTKIQENCFFYPEMTLLDNYSNKYDLGFVPNPPCLPGFVFPELPVVLPVFNEGGNDNQVRKAANAGGNLSQQSIAARIRRRKITEKTQELGKLIPGGQKMNTAEMFQAASKYIKFMQAQIGVLQLMQEEGMHSQELEALVTSPLVQEKLYSAEKCLVPKSFVKSLTQKPQLQSNPQLVKNLVKLI